MSSSPETGRRFGPYEIQSRLGGGGMGAVFRAWDARLHREVAIKLLHDEFTMPGMRERFLREARAASALNHPNICTIFDIGEQDGDPYLVMELLEGETLRARITHRTLQTDEIVCIGRDVAEALGAAHAKGVIHRDVKPANIFLIERSNASVQAKMLDFGLAKIEGGVLGARHSRGLDLTTAGSTVGTLAYMSPEQARGETLDLRSDLFSLGVVLYEMATRHVPFPGATSALVFVKLLNHPPEPVRDWNEAVPRELERIILKLMAKERTARYQTAQEVVEALSHIGEKGGGWLRKAVATVPLVRTQDPVARKRTLVRKREPGDLNDSPAGTPPQTAAEATPRPSSDTAAAQFLRPVARMPRADVTPVPSRTSPANQDPLSLVAADQMGSARAESGLNPDGVKVASTRDFAATQPSELAASSGSMLTPPDVSEPPAKASASGEFEVKLPDAFVTGPRRPDRRNWIAGLTVGFLLVALTVWYLTHGHSRFGQPLLGATDPLVVTEIENRTGDKSLDGGVAQALQFTLGQSPYFLMRSIESYDIVQHQRLVAGLELNGAIAMHEAAQRLGAKAYLYGSLKGESPPYLLHVDLVNTSSREVMTSAEEHAASLGEIPAAIDRLAATLRTNMGEHGDSIGQAHNALSREATSNLDALRSFSLGESARAQGHESDALRLYQEAARLDPKFLQAQLQLAELYAALGADVAAADAAKLALAAADTSSERMRTLAQAEYEMDVSGDLPRATGILRHALTQFPHDARILQLLARTLRLQGRMTESLQSAQQAIEEDRYNLTAYADAELALIGLDHYDAAFQLEGQLEKLGMMRPGATLTAAYLEGRSEALLAAKGVLQAPRTSYRPDWSYGVFLDTTGRLGEGGALWRERAAQAGEGSQLESAAGFLYSQGAVDEALVGDCVGGLAMARQSDNQPQGVNALFNSGMAHALCGDVPRAREIIEELRSQYPHNFAVMGFYLADLTAAVALREGDPAAALEALRPARQYDLISLTPYLRGLAHVALRQVQIGIVDFQTVLAHRGVAFLEGNTVYPVAEIGVARAFADTGDMGNSAEAYRRFLELWRDAEPGQPLVKEAQSHVQ